MKNIHKLLFIFIIFTALLVPSYSVKADPITTDNNTENISERTPEEEKEIMDKTREERKQKKAEDEAAAIKNQCNYIFGDPKDEGSVFYMIQKFFDYAKIFAPILVVLLSGIDFAKNALTGDQDAMKKATKKLGIRLGCAVGVYLAPLLVGFLLNFINDSSVDRTCNIK